MRRGYDREAIDHSPCLVMDGFSRISLGNRVRFEQYVNPRKIALFLTALAVFFALQSLVADYLVEEVLDDTVYPYAVFAIDLFSANAEQTFPTWYSSLLLLGAALLLFIIGSSKSRTDGQDRWLWLGLALIFLYLSLDEFVSIHEIAAEWLQTDFSFTGFFAFGWQLAAVPFLLLFAVLYLRFWLRLPSRIRLLFLIAGVVYVGGAFVIEGFSAALWDSTGGISYPYLVIATLEEFCEMLGVIVLIYALLSYIADEDVELVLIPVAAESTAPRAGIRFPRRVFAAAALVVIVNLAVVAWAMSTSSGRQSGESEGQFVYGSLIDQLAREGIVIMRGTGRFGFGAATNNAMHALAENFPSLTVINLLSKDSHIVIAADAKPYTGEELVEIFHRNGEVEFMILEDSAVRALLQPTAP